MLSGNLQATVYVNAWNIFTRYILKLGISLRNIMEETKRRANAIYKAAQLEKGTCSVEVKKKLKAKNKN